MTDRGGSIAPLAAILIAGILIVGSFVLDLSLFHAAQQRNQIIADAANVAAASVDQAISGSEPSAKALAAARNVAEINGVDPATMTTTAAASPGGDGALALLTRIETTETPALGLLSDKTDTGVRVASWAAVGSGGDCLVALKEEVRVEMEATIQGKECNVLAKKVLYLFSGLVDVASVLVGYPDTMKNMYITPSGTLKYTGEFKGSQDIQDPIAKDPRIVALSDRLGRMGGWPHASEPTPDPATPYAEQSAFTDATATIPPSAHLGAVTVTSSTLTFSGTGDDPRCATPTTFSGPVIFRGVSRLIFNSGCYAFGSGLTLEGGTAAVFEVPAGAKVSFVIRGGATLVGASQLTIGSATSYLSYGTISVQSGSSLTFEQGDRWIWKAGLRVWEGGRLALGKGDLYYFDGQFSNDGIAEFQDGTYKFGKVHISAAKTSTTTFGVGDYYFYQSSLHDAGGRLTFGEGGSPASGSGTLYMVDSGLEIMSREFRSIGDTMAIRGGVASFNGFGHVDAVAPMDATPLHGQSNILLTVFGGAFAITSANGGTHIFSGVVYAPWSKITIQSRMKIFPPDGGCLQFIAADLLFSQWSDVTLASCRGFGAGGSGSGRLLQ